MKLYEVTDSVVKHEEARTFIDLLCTTGDVNQVENGSQDLVHPLHVLYPRVELAVHVEYPRHLVISIRLPLLLLVRQEGLVRLIIVAVNELELLLPRRSEVGHHDGRALSREERELGVSARSVLFNLLP